MLAWVRSAWCALTFQRLDGKLLLAVLRAHAAVVVAAGLGVLNATLLGRDCGHGHREGGAEGDGCSCYSLCVPASCVLSCLSIALAPVNVRVFICSGFAFVQTLKTESKTKCYTARSTHRMAMIVSLAKNAAWRAAFMLRETGQAIERAGCQLQGIYSHEEQRECVDV